MAIIRNGIIGGFIGKLGGVVGYKRLGKNIIQAPSIQENTFELKFRLAKFYIEENNKIVSQRASQAVKNTWISMPFEGNTGVEKQKNGTIQENKEKGFLYPYTIPIRIIQNQFLADYDVDWNWGSNKIKIRQNSYTQNEINNNITGVSVQFFNKNGANLGETRYPIPQLGIWYEFNVGGSPRNQAWYLSTFNYRQTPFSGYGQRLFLPPRASFKNIFL